MKYLNFTYNLPIFFQYVPSSLALPRTLFHCDHCSLCWQSPRNLLGSKVSVKTPKKRPLMCFNILFESQMSLPQLFSYFAGFVVRQRHFHLLQVPGAVVNEGLRDGWGQHLCSKYWNKPHSVSPHISIIFTFLSSLPSQVNSLTRLSLTVAYWSFPMSMLCLRLQICLSDLKTSSVPRCFCWNDVTHFHHTDFVSFLHVMFTLAKGIMYQN